jgi:hypothetical protein
MYMMKGKTEDKQTRQWKLHHGPTKTHCSIAKFDRSRSEMDFNFY